MATTKPDTKAPSAAETIKDNDTSAELALLLAGVSKKTETFAVCDLWQTRDIYFFQRDGNGKRTAIVAKLEHGQKSKAEYDIGLALLEQDAALNDKLWDGIEYAKPPPITMMNDGRQVDAAGNKVPALPPGIVSQIAGQ